MSRRGALLGATCPGVILAALLASCGPGVDGLGAPGIFAGVSGALHFTAAAVDEDARWLVDSTFSAPGYARA